MILQAQDIVKTYAAADAVSTTVLRGASLCVEPEEFVAIVGPSGAGKSTLLHVLASLDVYDRGSIQALVHGSSYDYSAMNEAAFARYRLDNIGFVYQFHHLLPEFTAIENVMMPALIKGVSQREARRRASVLIERVGLIERTDHMPTELSGGEQQRIAIARAVMNSPALLFADEPTGNLDSVNAGLVRDLLRDLQREHNLTCIIATHSSEIAQSATRIIRMVDGRCV
jgi:lipoprotein-releasing system ATP-binding protein